MDGGTEAGDKRLEERWIIRLFGPAGQFKLAGTDFFATATPRCLLSKIKNLSKRNLRQYAVARWSRRNRGGFGLSGAVWRLGWTRFGFGSLVGL